jgi:aminoglycoside 2'-N-acetyltransferase I
LNANPGFGSNCAGLRALPTSNLLPFEISAIRGLLWAAFEEDGEGFTEDDWHHALGGTHVVLELDREIVAHASVVERQLHVDHRPLATGYVEAVAVAPRHQHLGLGSQLMREVSSRILDRFELGALGTGRQGFYERLGWLTWQGPSSVRVAEGMRRTPDDDGYIMVLPTRRSPPLDVTLPISCEWRSGDVW